MIKEELNTKNIEFYKKIEDIAFDIFYNQFFKSKLLLTKLNKNINRYINSYNSSNINLTTSQLEYITSNYLLNEIGASNLSQFSKCLFESIANQISVAYINKTINFEEICEISAKNLKEKINSQLVNNNLTQQPNEINK